MIKKANNRVEEIFAKYKKIQQTHARFFVRDLLESYDFGSENEIYLSFNEVMLSHEMLARVDRYQDPLMVLDHTSVKRVTTKAGICSIYFRDVEEPFVAPLHAIVRFIVPSVSIDFSFDCELDYNRAPVEQGRVLDFPW